jgi:hypothetical protein
MSPIHLFLDSYWEMMEIIVNQDGKLINIFLVERKSGLDNLVLQD